MLKVETGGKAGRVIFLTKKKKMIEAVLEETREGAQELAFTNVKMLDLQQNLIYAKITSDEKLITVEQQNNNLKVEDLRTRNTLIRYNGITEEPYSFEQYRSFRYAKEDMFPLWRKGLGSMVLLDPLTFEIE